MAFPAVNKYHQHLAECVPVRPGDGMRICDLAESGSCKGRTKILENT